MSGSEHGNPEHGNPEHFDEVDAVRRFPSEDTWLDLPMPDLKDVSGQEELADSSFADSSFPDRSFPDRSFPDRVMQARQEDLELDAQIAELDQVLPTEVLQQFGTPKPSDSFVNTTVEKITKERRQRWQEMLARYVAPEPSTRFVARTLAALQDGGATASGKQAGAHPQLQAPPGSITGRSNPSLRNNWPVFGLVAAAAAALLWIALTGDIRQPLELRLADQASPAVAYASSTSPMSAILAQVAEDEEPFAMFNQPANGLWLVSDIYDREEVR